MPDQVLEGGCRCGAIRYRLSEAPLRASLCHCRDCQRSAGAPAVVWMLAREEALTVTGEPRVYRSAPGVERSFCPRCGTGLFYRNEAIFPGKVDIQLVSLDDPSAVSPDEQVQVDERLAWMERLSALPEHRRYPSG